MARCPTPLSGNKMFSEVPARDRAMSREGVARFYIRPTSPHEDSQLFGIDEEFIPLIWPPNPRDGGWVDENLFYVVGLGREDWDRSVVDRYRDFYPRNRADNNWLPREYMDKVVTPLSKYIGKMLDHPSLAKGISRFGLLGQGHFADAWAMYKGASDEQALPRAARKLINFVCSIASEVKLL